MVTMVDTKEVWVVWTNIDLTEGRETEYALAYCELEATAKRMANYVQGWNSRVTKQEVFVGSDRRIYVPVALIVTPTNGDRRIEALLVEERIKLERKERAIARAKELGLSDEEIEALR